MTLEHVFRPRSVAVVGASDNPSKLGWSVLHNIVTYGFRGRVYPVNPGREYVHCIPCYASVRDIPGDVDLAVVVVPARYVEQVFLDCAEKGVRGAVVITAGFKEIGPQGEELERRILKIARDAGMRFVGPNCMGIINTDEDVSLNATFAPTQPLRGSIGFISQSGAMGVAVLDFSNAERIGFSKFASMGNKADVSGNDLVEMFGRDPNTKVILMYIENFGNPRNFITIARKVSESKPIIAVKSGRTKAGAAAASSHTGAIAGEDAGAQALFKQCGVLRALTIEEMFNYAEAFAAQRLPRGKRVAVLTNGGGPGIIAADAVEGHGLEMAGFQKSTVEALRSVLPREASVRNPVDMIAGATASTYRSCLSILLKDRNVDAVLVINVPLGKETELETAAAIAEASRFTGKPVLACLFGRKESSEGVRHLIEHGIPTYRFPEGAVRALAAMWRYRSWREKPKGRTVRFRAGREEAQRILDGAMSRDREWLTKREVDHLLELYGFRLPKGMVATTEDEAVRIAKKLNYPVVMKVVSDDIIHKWDVGGVALDIKGETELRRQYRRIMSNVQKKRPGARVDGIRVERMITGGREVILGMKHDSIYGSMIMFGLGGIYVETFRDVSFRISPLTDVDAQEMVEEIRGYQLLAGARGEKPCDIKRLKNYVLRLNQMVTELQGIREMDLNPVIALPKGAVVVDARVRLEQHGSQ